MEDNNTEQSSVARTTSSENGGHRNRPPSPPPIKSSTSPARSRRPRTPPPQRGEYSRSYDRAGGDSRRRNYSPIRRRNRSRSRSPEYRRDRRSRSTSRGRRAYSPRGGRRRPRTPPVPPPAMHHVPAYVPQPVFDQYQGYCNYVPTGYGNSTTVVPSTFDPSYMPPNPYMAPSGPAYGAPPPPVLNSDYIQPQSQWVPPQQQLIVEPVKPQDDAVAQEMQQQKETLRKQRDDYDKRRLGLRRELKILKEQRLKLTDVSHEPPSPTTRDFLKENDRLQAQIENKMSTIDNVIEMLTNIIGNDAPPGVDDPEDDAEKGKKRKKDARKRRKRSNSSDDQENSAGDSSNDDEKLKTKVIESIKQRSKAKEETVVPPDQQVNYAFYDPELHWCKACNVFPKTAKDYLNHLHSKDHADVVKKATESPWHENNQNVGMPTYPNAPTRRTPIRGLQFFVPATSWYCKLCSVWMGDLHCASLHLKSKCHSDSITKFVEHNPDFEVDFIRDRQKAFDTSKELCMQPAVDTVALPPNPSFEGIPLKLNLFGKVRTASESKEPKKAKKKKSSAKKDKKAAKKKSKGSKKRGSSSSSSSDSDDSSSSSSSSSSDAEAERVKALLTLSKRQAPQQPSIRNQMRRMEPEKVSSSQGNYNNYNNGSDRHRPAGRDVSQPRRRDSIDEVLEQRRRNRQPSEDVRDRSRSPGGFDRYRDRGRNRSRDRQYRRRGSRSRSPSFRRRRSRTRSRSRSPRRVIEKAVVNYPPQFKPRVPEKVVERRRTPPPKKATTTAASVATKKLPFIGRMPVFKKQNSGAAAGGDEVKQQTVKEEEKLTSWPPEKEVVPAEENKSAEEETATMVQQHQEEEDELMPDPEQMQRMLHDDQERTRQQEQQDMLPPGIDESESHLVPKPINDVPVPRRGPLPKDLEDALDIIFPGEKPEGHVERKPFVVTGHIKDNGTEIITGPEPEDEVTQNTAAMYQAFSAYQHQEVSATATPTASHHTEEEGAVESNGGLVEGSMEEVKAPVMSTHNELDMDELAMLGIDSTDLAAQCV